MAYNVSSHFSPLHAGYSQITTPWTLKTMKPGRFHLALPASALAGDETQDLHSFKCVPEYTHNMWTKYFSIKEKQIIAHGAFITAEWCASFLGDISEDRVVLVQILRDISPSTIGKYGVNFLTGMTYQWCYRRTRGTVSNVHRGGLSLSKQD
jgi:hypothetical protein